MRNSPWAELRRIKINHLFEAIAHECLSTNKDHLSFPTLKEIARHVLDHPSKSTMYDYFEDLEDSRWIAVDDNTVRLLKIPQSLKEQFKAKGPLIETIKA